MSITYRNANYRKKFDAFRIIDESGHEPLKQAIACALEMRSSAEKIKEAYDHAERPETKAQLTLALVKAIPDEFHAWIKIAEFVYSKPKHITVDGHMTYEALLDGTWKDLIGASNGNGNS